MLREFLNGDLSADGNEGSGDYSRLISQLMEKSEKVRDFFDLKPGADTLSAGIVNYGYLIASDEDITSRAYLSAIDQLCEMQPLANQFLCTPVFDGNSYMVYYIFFTDLISYNIYSIAMHNKGRFDGVEVVPYLFN